MDKRFRDAKELLNTKFGHENFLDGQEKGLESIFKNRNLLAVMPTGGGKSLLFQLPAQMMKGLTLVVSPLIALMKDQVDELTHKGIPATFVNSSLTLDEQRNRLERCIHGDVKLLYVAPERFKSAPFLAALEQVRIARLAVDEAHCISEWGHDFRPDYRKLKDFRDRMGNPLTTALTATATPRVQKDIIDALGLSSEEVDVHVHGFDRPNLGISVINAPKGEQKIAFLTKLIREQDGPGIIYTGTRKTTEEIGTKLRRLDQKVVIYHAGLESAERTIAQEKFMNGDARIAVATSAFGMGIDKHDVRFVTHYAYPGSVEQYYQEIGRAGRDGNPSRCDLLYSFTDRRLREFFIDLGYPSKEIIKSIYQVLWRIKQNPINLTYKQIAEMCDIKIMDGQVGSALRLFDQAGVARGLSGEPQATVILHQAGSSLLPKVQDEIQRKVFESLASFIDMTSPGRYDVSLPGISQESGMDTEQVRRALLAMQKNNIIRYESAYGGRGIEKLVEKPPPFGKLEIDWQKYEMLHNAEIDKHEKMVEYIQQTGCRREFILKYFGEENPIKCTTCDNCDELNPHKKTDICSEIPHIAIPILICAKHLRFTVGKAKLAMILAGSTAYEITKFDLQKNPAFGFLSLSVEDIKGIIDDLTTDGYLEVTGDSYRPVLKLSAKGLKVAKNSNLKDYQKGTSDISDYSRQEERTEIEDRIRMLILQCVDLCTTPYGISRVAEILTGSKAKWISPEGADKLHVYNSVDCTQEEARHIIKKMLKDNFLQQGGDDIYPVLELSDKGYALLNGEKPPVAATDEIKPEPLPSNTAPAPKPVKPSDVLPDTNLDKMLADLVDSDLKKAKELVQKLSIYHPAQISARLARIFDEHRDIKCRSRIIWAVGELGGHYGMSFLVKCASSDRDNFRRLAASALGKIASKASSENELIKEDLIDAQKALELLIKDKAKQVRQYAEKSLREFPV